MGLLPGRGHEAQHRAVTGPLVVLLGNLFLVTCCRPFYLGASPSLWPLSPAASSSSLLSHSLLLRPLPSPLKEGKAVQRAWCAQYHDHTRRSRLLRCSCSSSGWGPRCLHCLLTFWVLCSVVCGGQGSHTAVPAPARTLTPGLLPGQSCGENLVTPGPFDAGLLSRRPWLTEE